MKRPQYLYFSLAVFFLCSFLPRLAHAGSAPQMKAWVDSPTVGVGESIQLHLQATSSSDLSDPQPGVRSSFAVSGSSLLPGRTVTILNGVRTDTSQITATWNLVATRLGQATLAPSVVSGGMRFATNPISVQIVPASQAPRTPRPSATPQPFDPWKGIFGTLGGDDEAFDTQPLVTTDPALALDAPRARGAFLHAIVDKTSAVVGEQVTFSVYLYVDTQTREPDFNDVHEATADDFVKRSLLEDESNPRSIGHAKVAGRVWLVKLVRKWALFPLKTGDLSIAPMTLAVVAAAGMSGKRASETMQVHVTEPPLAGRPPGYTIGDVGRFHLFGEVKPRNVERGDVVSIDVELSGTGNLPASLVPPPRKGVEWLTPEVHDTMTADGDTFGGKRHFSYIVKLSHDGDIDLGEITIPFWDPDAHAYGVARAPLGVVKVARGTKLEADSGADLDPLPGLPPPRTARVGEGPAMHPLSDRPLFWLSIVTTPLAFVIVAGGGAVRKRVTRALRARASSPETELKRRIDEAAAISSTDDARAADAAIVRAIEYASIVRAGTNVRAVAARDVAGRLIDGGVSAANAESLARVLAACEAARFSPELGDIDAVRERWRMAKKGIDALPRTRPKGEPG